MSAEVAEGRFKAIGTTNRILVTDEDTLPDALRLAQAHLDELDAVVSRFRADSEVTRLAAEPGPIVRARVSTTLSAYLRVALQVAAATDGLVDPTVGAAVRDSGYDADIAEVRERTALAGRAAAVPGWSSIELDEVGHLVMPGGTLLDLGASAKAHAADTIAADLAARLPGGFLVNLGGDIAVAGEAPETGWQVGIELADHRVPQVVSTRGAGLATSSTRHRRWSCADGERHHIVDPRTGATAPAEWAQVTCVAATACAANAMSTAAVVLGVDAPRWLAARGIAARLDRCDGMVVVTTPGWPSDVGEVAA